MRADAEYSTIGRLIIGQYVDTTIFRKLEEEKVKWARRGLELTGDHVDWAEEYSSAGVYTFFDALEFFYQLLKDGSVPDWRPAKNMCFRCKSSVVKGLGECQQCGEEIWD